MSSTQDEYDRTVAKNREDYIDEFRENKSLRDEFEILVKMGFTPEELTLVAGQSILPKEPDFRTPHVVPRIMHSDW